MPEELLTKVIELVESYQWDSGEAESEARSIAERIIATCDGKPSAEITLSEIVEETIANIERVEENLSRAKRRLQEHL